MTELEGMDFGAEQKELADNCRRNMARLLEVKRKLASVREERRSLPIGTEIKHKDEREFRRLVNGSEKELRKLTKEVDHTRKLAEIQVHNRKLEMQRRELEKQNRELEESITKLALGILISILSNL